MTISETITNLGNAIINLVNTREKSSNKVTSLSASSTDTQYPSAKCVYDAIQAGGGGADVEAYTAAEVQTLWGSI